MNELAFADVFVKRFELARETNDISSLQVLNEDIHLYMIISYADLVSNAKYDLDLAKSKHENFCNFLGIAELSKLPKPSTSQLRKARLNAITDNEAVMLEQEVLEKNKIVKAIGVIGENLGHLAHAIGRRLKAERSI